MRHFSNASAAARMGVMVPERPAPGNTAPGTVLGAPDRGAGAGRQGSSSPWRPSSSFRTPTK